ncbi:hypothetical protein [Rathayibacter soli]|uniref:hypothetical protein n=1 Tax=Rathayibacter soli TaxID=3144168 RepID=UPI0027E4828C|nr:hypothetical protein [Glaciibacter superstes]
MNASEGDAVETNGGGSHPQDSKGKHVADDQAHDDGRFATSNQSSTGLSALAADMAHPFDQTNGLVDGLEVDHDDPENVDKRTSGSEPDFIADPDGGVLGVVPAGSASHGRRNDDAVDGEPDTDDPDTDKEEPQGP